MNPRSEHATTCYIVPEESNGQRLDQFLASLRKDKTRGYFQKLIEQQLVLINEKTPKPSYLIKSGEKVYVSERLREQELKAEQRELDIVFEDEEIIVVNKPIDMVVHPLDPSSSGTLVQALLARSIEIADAVYDVNSLVSRLRPGIVHRLDKNTSGIMVIAKNQAALHHLAKQFKEHTVEKEYTALLFGSFSDAVTIHTNIRRKPTQKNKMGVSRLLEEGREAITHLNPQKVYYSPQSGQELTLTSCKIETGRTHQIRVHCKYSGHPVIGDPLYNHKPSKLISQELGATRQLLHATKLSFTHPKTGKFVTFSVPLAPDIQQILTRLRAT